jgi:proton-coupled amino acid transporter
MKKVCRMPRTATSPTTRTKVMYVEQEEEDENAGRTTSFQSFVALIKGYIGPGCLSLPWAVSQLGLGPGVAACFLMAYWSSYNCWTVVTLKRQVATDDATYADVAGCLCGVRAKRLTSALICVQQLAICTVFLSFVGANLEAVLESCFEVELSHISVITMALPAVMALSFLPNLKALAPVMILGTALLLMGLTFLSVVVVIEWPNRPMDLPQTEWRNVPLALCAILYSYEGICLILPVEGAMKEKRRFFKIFATAMTFVATIFALVASLSVTAFGNVTSGSITAFLLEHYKNDANIKGWLLAANAAVSLSVLVTYPLQLFPCIELIAHSASLRTNFQTVTTSDDPTPTDDQDESSAAVELDQTFSAISPSPSQEEPVEYITFPWTRVGLVLLTYFVAILVPNVQCLISLAGALAGSSVALLLPPILVLARQRQEALEQADTENEEVYQISSYKTKVRSYVLLGFGVIFTLIGTVASIADIVRVYQGKA